MKLSPAKGQGLISTTYVRDRMLAKAETVKLTDRPRHPIVTNTAVTYLQTPPSLCPGGAANTQKLPTNVSLFGLKQRNNRFRRVEGRR